MESRVRGLSLLDKVFLNRSSKRSGVLFAMCILTVVGLFIHTWGLYASSEHTPYLNPTLTKPLPVTVAENTPQLMHYFWKPFLHEINNTNFVSDEGYKYETPKDARHWTKPLRKKLLILDVDTREDNGPGGMMNQSTLSPKEMTGRAGGMMNHYLYAMIHGYDYKFVRAPGYPNRHATWVKVPIIKEALKTHEIVVFLDADAVFMYPHVPFEWLMRLWNITDKTLIALANDPDSEKNRDASGKVMMNTGFMIAQQSDETQELFDKWDQCPTSGKYQGCDRWAKEWAHEQGAFSNHIRYDYNSTEKIGVIPCMDGNGAPYIGDKTCGGVFIRHHWFRKNAPAEDLQRILLNTIVSRLHVGFQYDMEQNFVDLSRYRYPLKDLGTGI
ncbi:hypothetical protein FHETE_825 [Fusarium heterosporum]|uniref:Nucleotide-diphospho-sugar transferase domain-containing protein n=1 Tax=Fusarium heterosporum TaxID=42747 RepID=A0A8H5U1L8_FUSHE|nr:hypothetical protein FHETE_825 [Fusarium heterosporum]